MVNTYLHGYSKKEQNRLIIQARLLSDDLYKGVDFHRTHHVLEVGVGVGAQTEILLEKFPHLKITGVDLSEAQIKLAEKRLSKEIKTGQVNLIQMNAEKLDTLTGSFDGAFICWFLEHVPNPEKVLKALHKKLSRGSKVFITEGMNAGFFVDPYSPAILKYWFEFNDFQWATKGNPFMGARLGNLLTSCKFKNIEVEPRTFFYDSRERVLRNKFLTLVEGIMLSAAPHLLEDERITKADINKIKKEFNILRMNKDSVIHLDYFRATALK